MEQLIQEVVALTVKELVRAEKRHGALHHSAHEAYAVTLEERDEGIKNVAEIDKCLDEFWLGVVGNNKELQEGALRKIEELAVLAACEYIQVAAMSKKALKGYEKYEPEDNGDEE